MHEKTKSVIGKLANCQVLTEIQSRWTAGNIGWLVIMVQSDIRRSIYNEGEFYGIRNTMIVLESVYDRARLLKSDASGLNAHI